MKLRDLTTGANLLGILSLFLFLIISYSCNKDEIEDLNAESKIQSADLKMGIHFDSWQDQVDWLRQKTQRFHNFQVSQAQGWTFRATEHMSQMGVHYINPDLMDGNFDFQKPEALLYVEEDDGSMTFVGVEYLIVGIGEEGPAPEGFIGDADEWHYNPAVPAWTLHTWVGLENPNGVFEELNPEVKD